VQWCSGVSLIYPPANPLALRAPVGIEGQKGDCQQMIKNNNGHNQNWEIPNNINNTKDIKDLPQLINVTSVYIATDLFNRYFIVCAEDTNMAWTGSAWIEHVNGVGLMVQVSNFATLDAAVEYAIMNGFIPDALIK
jgi:hypothetical protein